MSDIEVSKTVTEVVPDTEVEISPSAVEPIIEEKESIISGSKKEYSIVGDAYYAPNVSSNPPDWLVSIIDSVISASLDSSLTELQTANVNISNALTELDIAKNQYEQLININVAIDAAIASKLEVLNATVDQNSSDIKTLEASKVTANEAAAIAATQISSELNNGAIRSELNRIDTTIATTNASLAATTEILEADYQGLNSAQSVLENTVIANAEKAEANFSYNSTIKINDTYYNSGFGIQTQGTYTGSGTEVDPYNSEFWINAERFIFTNSAQSGQAAPFTIDASGVTPNVTFNGVVDFTNTNMTSYTNSNISINADGTLVGAGGGQVTAGGLGAVLPEEVAQAVNDNVTTINGSKITTGTIQAAQIATNTITANEIATNTITANEIAASTITSNEIAASTITANEIAANTIDAGKLNVSQLSAISADIGTITAGTINADVVNAGILNLDQVPTITKIARFNNSNPLSLTTENTWVTLASVTVTAEAGDAVDILSTFTANKYNGFGGISLRILRGTTLIYGSSVIGDTNSSLFAVDVNQANSWFPNTLSTTDTPGAGTHTYYVQFASHVLSSTPYQTVRQRYMKAEIFKK